MTAPEIKGWCPGALRPMESGDGWLVRVRPRGGRLTQAQAAGLAALAEAHGNGAIGLSSRANVQIRGVAEGAIPAMTDGLRDLGLLDPDAETEGRRNILVAPDWSLGDSTQAIVAAMEQGLASENAPALPGKFGFAVDIGQLPQLRAASADVRIERAGGALIVRADGCDRGIGVTEATAADAALLLARWFVDSGGVAGGRGRMAAHLAHATLPAAFTAAASETCAAPAPDPGPRSAGFLVAFEFGQIDAATLAALSAFGPLRMTPWRMILVEGLGEAPSVPRLIADARDPRLRIVACTGAPGCAQGLRPTGPLARRFARIGLDPVIMAGVTHISGCAKGCAHPGRADRVVVAKLGGWVMARDCKAQDAPDGPALPTYALGFDHVPEDRA